MELTNLEVAPRGPDKENKFPLTHGAQRFRASESP